MGQPAAKQGDQVTAMDIHLVIVPGTPPVTVPLPHPFTGILDGSLSANVKIEGRAAATVGSTATNTPPHIPTPPGASFSVPPKNRAQVIKGSATVRINGKPAARAGDTALTCNDPVDAPIGTVVAQSLVLIGG